MEEIPSQGNLLSDGHVLSPAKEVLTALLKRTEGDPRSRSWTGRQRPAGGGLPPLLRISGLFWAHKEPIQVLRCHDAWPGAAHVEVVLL